jgi:hypothetical protein
VAAGKAEALGVTPALMRSLMHALSFIYTRCIDDDNLEGNMVGWGLVALALQGEHRMLGQICKKHNHDIGQ